MTHRAEPPSVPGSSCAGGTGRPYTEVGGHSMVLVPERRMCVEIAPGALALWGALGDRTLAAVLADLPAPPELRPPPDEAVEVVRRWRALGLIEERAVLGVETETDRSTAGEAHRDATRPPRPWIDAVPRRGRARLASAGPDAGPCPPAEQRRDRPGWARSSGGWPTTTSTVPGWPTPWPRWPSNPSARARWRQVVPPVADTESWTP